MQRRRQLLKRLPKNGVGCEIGTWEGEFAAHLLRELEPETLYLIDPWTFQPEYPNRWYGGAIAKNKEEMDLRFHRVKSMFANNEQVKIHRGTIDTFSTSAICAPNTLDWVYIDGNHSYEYVLNDLQKSYPLMKKGGVMTGDDMHWPPLRTAVEDFVRSIAKSVLKFEIVDTNQFVIYLKG